MKRSNHQLLQDFFAAIARGELPENLVTADMTFWSVNSGSSDKARFLGGIKVLASIFSGTLAYRVDSLTSEDDRAVAEVSSQGTLPSGEAFANTHVFIFRLRDGKIASVAEFMNQFLVREKILPLLQAATT
jgi:ketosteroid isomerase-like protein